MRDSTRSAYGGNDYLIRRLKPTVDCAQRRDIKRSKQAVEYDEFFCQNGSFGTSVAKSRW